MLTIPSMEDRSVCFSEPKNARLVYLITYSRADISLVPTRETFAMLILHAFENGDPSSPCNVVQWVCTEELHSDNGIHYHMAVKFQSCRRWLKYRNFLDSNHNLKVNFSGVHVNYYSAWRYVTKNDTEYMQSPDHPDLANEDFPTTTNASQSVQGQSVEEEPNTDQADGHKRKRKRKRLSIFDVSQLAVSKRIKTRLELLALANAQKREGKNDLAEFIANRGVKAVEEALAVGWELEEAEKKLERSRLSRLQVLEKKLNDPCADGC